MIISVHLIDLFERNIYPAELEIDAGKIVEVRKVAHVPEGAGYLLPGFVDAHVHIESSMLPPTEFARLAVVHGTIATVSDPHEIANVLGVEGVEYMLHNARNTPFQFCFGAPSCVPATCFETAGAILDAAAVDGLLAREDIGYLSEVMNFPGVLNADPDMLAKIAAAQRLGKPVDGHAPGLRGADAERYFAAGIQTDHECFSYEEGLGKARLGVKILIREGSAAKNFEALWPLLLEFPNQIMFCSDDKHPDDLIHGHINQLVVRALEKGCPLFDVLRAACLHPVEHYRIGTGLLRPGDRADFIRISDLETFQVLETWLAGECVARQGKSLLPHQAVDTPNQFLASHRQPEDFEWQTQSSAGAIRVIGVDDGEIVTRSIEGIAPIREGRLCADPASDLLKIAVVNRYTHHAPVAIGMVQGFGLHGGALASSVAHDSHNIVAVGTSDAAICAAVNAVIEHRGGISAANDQGEVRTLGLPIAGLMSPADGYSLAAAYSTVDAWVKSELGCVLHAPFMTLSFLALPVIPALKMTDLGLFDVGSFGFVDLELYSK